MISFKVCDNPIDWMPETLCPRNKLHGHLWKSSHFDVNTDIPITLLPVVISKTLALQILFELCDLLTGDALEYSPAVERVKNEIANSSLPDEDI